LNAIYLLKSFDKIWKEKRVQLTSQLSTDVHASIAWTSNGWAANAVSAGHL
jgi:hypothetical protein